MNHESQFDLTRNIINKIHVSQNNISVVSIAIAPYKLHALKYNFVVFNIVSHTWRFHSTIFPFLKNYDPTK